MGPVQGAGAAADGGGEVATPRRLGPRAAKALLERQPRDVHEAIRNAEAVLPGVLGPHGSGTFNARWRAILLIDEFLPDQPEAVWEFVSKWGCHRSQDLRAAVSVLLVEDLLYECFDFAFPRVRQLMRKDDRFAEVLTLIYWSDMSAARTRQMKRLMAEAERRRDLFERRERRRNVARRRKARAV